MSISILVDDLNIFNQTNKKNFYHSLILISFACYFLTSLSQSCLMDRDICKLNSFDRVQK